MNLRWTKKKPKLNKECLLITAQNWGKEQGWSYTAFSIEKVECDGRWYLGIITSDGDEWGDIDDLKADKYLVLPLLKPLTNNPTGIKGYSNEYMKTAMQELIEQLKEERLSNPIESPLNIGLSVAIGFASNLLEKEKQQIIEAHDEGEGKIIGNGEKYYNQTFKQ